MARQDIAFVNRKGGSGKTTTAFNVAGALVERGYSVLAIDLDPQGSFSKSLQVYPGEEGVLSELLVHPGPRFPDLIQTTWLMGFDVIPADPDLKIIEMRLEDLPGREYRLRQCLRHLPHGYDFIIIDSPPSLGFLTVNAMTAATGLIIPVDGGSYGMEALVDTLEGIRVTQENLNFSVHVLGILLNNVNMRTSFDQSAEDTLRDQFGDLVFQTVIPNSIRVDEANQRGRPLVFYDRSSPLTPLYRQLTDEILRRGAGHAH
jgi:chromosome partitioning protein